MVKIKVNKEMCGICKKIIVIPGEEYCILAQYKRDNTLTNTGTYHIQCFREKFMTNNNVNQLIERTTKLLSKAELAYT